MSSLVALTALVPWAIPQVLAQYASNCGAQSPPQYFNASLEYLIRSPFTTPSGLFQGGSGDWIWNIGTVSYALTDQGKSGSVTQSLWLETASFIDLTSPSIGHVGCGAIFHGLTYAATVNGQADSGDCGLTLSPASAYAMLYNVASAAHNTSSLTSEQSDVDTDAAAVCANLAIPIPAACDAFFTKNALHPNLRLRLPRIHLYLLRHPSRIQLHQSTRLLVSQASQLLPQLYEQLQQPHNRNLTHNHSHVHESDLL